MEEIFGTNDHATDFIIGGNNHLHHGSINQIYDSSSLLNFENKSIDVKNDGISKSYSQTSFESSSNTNETFSPQMLSEDIFGDDDNIYLNQPFNQTSFVPPSLNNQNSSLSMNHIEDEKEEDKEILSSSSASNLLINSQSTDADSITSQNKDDKVLFEINLDDDDDEDTDRSSHEGETHDKRSGFFNMITGIKIPFMKSPSTSSVSPNEMMKHNNNKNEERESYLEFELEKSRQEIQNLENKLNEMMKQNTSLYELENLKNELERKDKLLIEANNNSKKWKEKYEDTFLRYESIQEEFSKLKEEMNKMKRLNGSINEEFDFNKRLDDIKKSYNDDLERIKMRFQNELEKEKKMNALDKNHNKQLIDKIKERAQKDIEFLQSQIESQNKIIEKLLLDNSELIDANALTRRIQIESKVPGSIGAIVKENEMLERMVEELEKKNELLEKENENMKLKLSIIESKEGEDDTEWKISSKLITPITSTTNTPAPTPTQLFRV